MDEERMQVLKMIETGQISTEEAFQLLEALNGTDQPEETTADAPPEPPPVDLPNTENFWLYPTVAGAVVMAVGAPLMALGLTGQAALLWALFCGWGPFLLGLTLLSLGVWSRNARWLHLRVYDVGRGRRTFVLSLPLPLTLTAWVLRVARPFVPPLQETAVDEVILTLRDELHEGEDRPFFIDVQDDEGGEHVQIYVG